MMISPISIIDSISFLAILTAIIILWRGWKHALGHNVKLLLAELLLLTLFCSFSNVLEWSGITNALDPFEDFVEILVPVLWCFLFYAFLQEMTEKDVRESGEKYRAIFEATGTATVIIEEDTTISLANTEFEKLSGYSKKEIEGKKSWTEFVAKEDLERMKKYHHLRRINPNAAPRNYEFQFIDAEGNIKNIFLTVAMIPGTRKSVASLLDITERKKMEEALRESEKRIRSLVENANDAIYIISSEGFEYVNPAFEELVGYTSKEICSKDFNFWNIVHHEDMKLIKKREEARKRRKEIPSRYEFRIIAKDGKTKTVEATTVDIGEKGEIKVMGILRDVTERREAEGELKKAYEEVERALKQEREFKLRAAHYFFNPIAI
ncbi:MAG: PAS domain S-box protein, partial [Thermoplasmata archaeon]